MGLELTGGLFKADRGPIALSPPVSICRMNPENFLSRFSGSQNAPLKVSGLPALIAIPALMNLKGPEFLSHRAFIEMT